MNTAALSYQAGGDIVSTNANTHLEEIERLLARMSGSQVLELDLRASRMIDSVGLNVIVKTIRTAEGKGGRIRMLIGNESIKRICTFTRLDQKAEVVGP